MNSKFSAYHKNASKLLRAARCQLADESIPAEVVAPLIVAARRALQVAAEARIGGKGMPAEEYDVDDLSRRESCIEAAENLEKALVDAKRVYLARHAKRFKRTVARCASVAQLVLFIIGLAVVSVGIYYLVKRPPEDSGLHATYFSSARFMGHPFFDVAQDLDFDWPQKAPSHLNARRSFSARWEGCIYIGPKPMALQVETTENHLRMRIDGDAVVDITPDISGNAGKQDGLKKASSPVLSPGVHAIVIESEHNSIPARHRIRLKPKDGKLRPVAAASLIPPGGNSQFNCELQRNKSSEANGKKVANAVTVY